MAVGGMVDICYRSSEGTLTSRTIRPLSFSMVGGNVATIAFCTLRSQTRTFYLDSITEARPAWSQAAAGEPAP
jgi:predicted DNA-binding transcriptional regulator YafY